MIVIYFSPSTAGVAAEIVRKPSNTLAPLGTDARFEIELCGEPEPEVKWFVLSSFLLFTYILHRGELEWLSTSP